MTEQASKYDGLEQLLVPIGRAFTITLFTNRVWL
jgi:hypothetical protein